MRGRDAENIHQAQGVVGQVGGGDWLVHLRAGAGATVVKGNHAVVTAKGFDLGQPGAMVAGKTVDQHYRRALADVEVT